MTNLKSYIKKDIRKLGGEIKKCPKEKSSQSLLTYLVTRKHTLLEVLSKIDKL